jgi:hypothetical protein
MSNGLQIKEQNLTPCRSRKKPSKAAIKYFSFKFQDIHQRTGTTESEQDSLLLKHLQLDTQGRRGVNSLASKHKTHKVTSLHIGAREYGSIGILIGASKDGAQSHVRRDAPLLWGFRVRDRTWIMQSNCLMFRGNASGDYLMMLTSTLKPGT